MRPHTSEALLFTRGPHFYQIAKARDGDSGYIGLKDGRVVIQAQDRMEVARQLIGLGVVVEISRVDLQNLGDLSQDRDCRIALAALDPPEVTHRKAGFAS